MEIQKFIQTLATLLYQYYPEQLDPSLKPRDSADCMACRNRTYDFIIVGAGAAGCVLANRLSENPDWSILLIEAGGDEDFITDTPALSPTTHGGKYDWNYNTVVQKKACLLTLGKCIYARGKVMGGSSTISDMVFDRGPQVDFDEWEQMGNNGWANKDIFKYILKSENMTIPELTNDPYHYTKGPQSIGYSTYIADIMNDVKAAAVESGLQVLDYNGRQRTQIVNYPQKTISGATRCSASKAFLNPIRNRKNLVIFKNTEVIQVLFENGSQKRAIGVRCVTNGDEYNVFATKEVILSAGAINTPKLLMQSGVGPKNDLEKLGINVVVDHPAVGNNLFDQPLLPLIFELKNYSEVVCCDQYTYDIALKYAKDRRGPLTTNGFDCAILMNTKNSTNLPPDVLSGSVMGTLGLEVGKNKSKLLTFVVGVANSKSKGWVRLASSKYYFGPLIHPNFYAVQSDMDMMLWGIKKVFEIIKKPELAKYSPKWYYEFVLPCDIFPVGSEEHLECYVKFMTITFWHPVGTCRMGPNILSNSVVDTTLKVHGINGLRIVDASVMPRIPRALTLNPTYVVAEKAADLIKQTFPQKEQY